MTFSLDDLRRWPDLEGPDLQASDAADRLLLDESTAARQATTTADTVVIGDSYGALTLGAVNDDPPAAGQKLRVHQDGLTGERALTANAERMGASDTFASRPLDSDLVRGAKLVLMRLPRSLDALRDIAALIAADASPDVAIFAGGRIKHMTLAMNDVLREHFTTVDVTHARQKSRVLIARGPQHGRAPLPQQATHGELVVCAFGGAFAGTSIDIGTRLLLEYLPTELRHDGAVIDLACGTGVVAAALAKHASRPHVIACDQSAIAVKSARATAKANGVADRVSVIQDDMLARQPDATASLIALNPPFHVGAAISDEVAPRMFADAARVLRPGGELYTVWNSALKYRGSLERLVGPTRQLARNTKFTVTVSTKR
ncbi:class I SAM-dependent methyltransferase (plasmid) [Coraliomargarita sp. W4R53]